MPIPDLLVVKNSPEFYTRIGMFGVRDDGVLVVTEPGRPARSVAASFAIVAGLRSLLG
jgi:hypothetical protein